MTRQNSIALRQGIIDRMRPEDRKALKLQTRAELDAAYEAVSEREIQRTVETWLGRRGYRPRTGESLSEPPFVQHSGWYMHLNEPRRNPYMLDLFVWSLRGRCIEIELKTATGRVRPVQAAILAAGGSVALCRSAKEAIDALIEWDRGNASPSVNPDRGTA